MPQMDSRIAHQEKTPEGDVREVKTKTEARQGYTVAGGAVRTVLIAGVVLVIIGFILSWLFFGGQ